MFIVLISLVLILVVDWALLFSKFRPRSIVIGHVAVALLTVAACTLKSEFDLGPHIEIPGWIGGLIIAGLSLFATLLAIGVWQVLISGRK